MAPYNPVADGEEPSLLVLKSMFTVPELPTSSVKLEAESPVPRKPPLGWVRKEVNGMVTVRQPLVV